MTDEFYPVPRARLESEIIARARSQPGFVDILLSEPRLALNVALGMELPDWLTVEVVQERSDHLCVVLPVDLSGISPVAVRAATGRRANATGGVRAARLGRAPSVE